jgi:hypothetical protein
MRVWVAQQYLNNPNFCRNNKGAQTYLPKPLLISI